jgi:hypothetical protein
MTRRQCEKCPWKQSTNPREIPFGYSEAGHRALARTIYDGTQPIAGPLRIMACHDYSVGAEQPCVGWLAHQLGPGNNLPLRWAVRLGRISADVETVGPQHPTFEATLPRSEAP